MSDIRTFADDLTLARAAATDWLGLVGNGTGPHLAALSGGRISKSFFAAIAELSKSSGASLGNVHFFWADERCVPPSDADSNYLVADENLLRRMRIAPEKIHRIKGEAPAETAVAQANAEIRRIAPQDAAGIP